MDIPPITRREVNGIFFVAIPLWFMTGCRGRLPWERDPQHPVPAPVRANMAYGSIEMATTLADPYSAGHFQSGRGGVGDPQGFFFTTLLGRQSDFEYRLSAGARALPPGVFEASSTRFLNAPWRVVWVDMLDHKNPVLVIESA